uniref:Uncharacterized protein n=1 Tax=Setaria viridis TaxID=4556 RepID=A0A4U6WEJ4_SETVI|nr:hypothetical protein SEVIR_1G301500v2 [Setaria viridis]
MHGAHDPSRSTPAGDAPICNGPPQPQRANPRRAPPLILARWLCPYSRAVLCFGGSSACTTMVMAPASPPVQRPDSPPAPVPVAGPPIRMAPLDPNPAFWARYRMGLERLLDFLGLGLGGRPESPSPSFGDWIDDGRSKPQTVDEE